MPESSVTLRSTGAPHRETGVECRFSNGAISGGTVLLRRPTGSGSSKSTFKTIAKTAEQERRRELESGYNNVKEVRQNRIRVLEDIIDEYLIGYRLRYRSATFAEYALGHVSRCWVRNWSSTSTKPRSWDIGRIGYVRRPRPSRSTKRYGFCSR